MHIDPNLKCLVSEMRQAEQDLIDADWNGQECEGLRARVFSLRQRVANGEVYEIAF